MVKFGETIEMDRRPEWIDGYVDYAGLKALLKKMEAAGTIRECGARRRAPNFQAGCTSRTRAGYPCLTGCRA
jgi:hypothetical protein